MKPIIAIRRARWLRENLFLREQAAQKGLLWLSHTTADGVNILAGHRKLKMKPNQ